MVRSHQCLKMSMPGWAPRPDLEKDPSILWMKFDYPGGSHSWSTRHLGEIIEYDAEGMPVNKGKCPVCGGTGKVRR